MATSQGMWDLSSLTRDRTCTPPNLVAVSGGYSSAGWAGCLLQWLLLLLATRCRVHGLQQLQLPGSRAQAQYFWHTGLVAPRPVGSSQIRDQTHVSCISKRILYHLLSFHGSPVMVFESKLLPRFWTLSKKPTKSPHTWNSRGSDAFWKMQWCVWWFLKMNSLFYWTQSKGSGNTGFSWISAMHTVLHGTLQQTWAGPSAHVVGEDKRSGRLLTNWAVNGTHICLIQKFFPLTPGSEHCSLTYWKMILPSCGSFLMSEGYHLQKKNKSKPVVSQTLVSISTALWKT